MRNRSFSITKVLLLITGLQLLLFSPHQLLSQQIPDSILLKLDVEKSDSIKVAILIKYTNEFEFSNISVSKNLISKAIEIAQNSGNSKSIADCYNRLGYLYSVEGNFVEALKEDLKSLNIYSAIKDSVGYAEALNNVGVDYRDMHRFDYAFDYLIKSKAISSITHDSINLNLAIFNIGKIFYHLGKYDEATEHFNLSALISKNLKQHDELAWITHELGKVALRKGQFEKAEQLLLESIRDANKNQIALLLPRTYLSMAEYYNERNEPLNARKYYDSLLTQAIKYNNNFLRAQALSGLGLVEFKLNHLNKANQLLTEGVQIFNDLNATFNMMNNLKTLAQINGELGDLQAAYRIHKQYFILNDSLNEMASRINVTQTERNVEADEIDRLNKEHLIHQEDLNKKSFQLKIFAALLLLFALLIGLLLYNRIRLFRLNKQLTSAYSDLVSKDIELTHHIAELKKAHSNLETNNASLREAKNNAEKANASKSEFLANVSHELRTPLNGVIGFADLLSKTPLNKIQLKYLGMASQSAKMLLSLIDDILDYAKLDANKLQLTFEKTDLVALCNQVIDMIRYQADSKGLQVEILLDSELPQFIKTDEIRLKQILANLLSNAVKFTNHGTITLSVQLQKILEDKTIGVQFSVRDTGIGIDQKNQKKIFEAFVQEDISTTKKYGGTGLGLTISNKLLTLMGSHLNLTSEVEKGSDFFFDVNFKLA